MIHILTSSKTILEVNVRSQESNPGDSAAEGLLHLQLKQQLTSDAFIEQQGYLSNAAISAYVSLNKLDQRQRYRARVNLTSVNNEDFNFAKGSSSSGLGYALALFESWWSLVLKKPGEIKYPVFATGEMLTSGHVLPIKHLASKIKSTCDYVEANKETIPQFYLCYPEQNDKEIKPDQRAQVKQLGGILLPVSRLQVLLGELLGNSYDGDPLGRWKPFKGLNSFDYEDSVRFFGRDKDVDRLYDDIKKNNGLLIVAGASGAGKSSLIKAGLIPRLEQETNQFYWAYTTPNKANQSEGIIGFIFDQLNVAWELEENGVVIKDLIATFRRSTNSGTEQLQSCLGNQTKHCLLYLDQYEEVFSQQQNIEAITQELKLIDELSRQLEHLDIVLALRNEYLGRLLDNQALQSPVISNVASQLSPDDWHSIIHEQAAFSGLSFEKDSNNQSLDKVIISEAVQTPFALPMVEFLLEQLYLKATKDNPYSNTLRFSDYEMMGGLSGAIAYRAKQVIEQKQADSKLVAQLFDTFVGLNSESLPFARQVHLEQIGTTEPAIHDLIQSFADANLIVSVRNASHDQIVKLAHDSLFSRWDELKNWIENYKDYLGWRYSIDGQYHRWIKSQTNNESGVAHLLKDKELLGEGNLYLKKEIVSDAGLQNYIRTSKKKKYKNAFSLGFWLVILPLSITAYYLWDQHRIKSYYYSAIGEKWSVPYGISEMSPEQVAHNQSYYRLDYQGGLLRRTQHKHLNFQIDEHQNMEQKVINEYVYKEDGQLSSITTKSSANKIVQVNRFQFDGKSRAIVSFNKSLDQIKFSEYVGKRYKEGESEKNKSDISQHKLIYSKEGFIQKRVYQNPYGVNVSFPDKGYGSEYVYDENGQVIAEYGLGNDGESPNKNGLVKELSKYDDNGRLVKKSRVNQSDGFQNNIYKSYTYDTYSNVIEINYDLGSKDGFAGANFGYTKESYKYNISGNVIEVAYYDAKGVNVSTNGGFSIARFKYNDSNLITEISIFDVDNKPMLSKEGYFRADFEYDLAENISEISFYGVGGEPIIGATGFAKRTIEYDAFGKPVAHEFFGIDGEPVLQIEGCFRSTFKYDERGNGTEQSCYGTDGSLALNTYGFAIARLKQDAYGRNTEEAFYGLDRRPILTSRGFSKLVVSYDDKGSEHSSVYSYYGVDNNPILWEGSAKDSYTFSSNGFMTEVQHYGTDHKPIAVNGVARTTIKTDDQGNTTELVYFGVNGQRVVDRETGASRTTIRYNSSYKPAETVYYGVNNELVISNSGFARVIEKYNAAGQVVEVSFFGVDNKPLYLEGAGYATSKTKYDSKGNIAELAYFGVNGEPIMREYPFHKLINEYDANGNYLSKVFHFDEKGNAIFHFDTWLAQQESNDGDATQLKVETQDVKLKTPISVDANVSGAKVFFNEKYIGITELELNIKPGKYTILVSKNDFIPYSKTFIIKPDENLSISAQLEAITKVGIDELRRKAELGDAEAQKNLGNRYLNGDGVETNYLEAMHWYRESARQGHPKAQHNIGLMYEEGYGVEKDLSEAFNWYKSSAEQGFPNAQFKLGSSYYFGRGVAKNTDETLKWLSKASQQGYAFAQYILGDMYFTGTLVGKNDLKALELYTDAAKQGHVSAFHPLANMHNFGGNGVKIDGIQAFYWYKKMADSEDGDELIDVAEYMVGSKYELGHGRVVDYEKAFFWYQKAANKGHPGATVALGNLYIYGYGVEKSYDKGLYWLRQAAKSNDELAIERLNQLGEKL